MQRGRNDGSGKAHRRPNTRIVSEGLNQSSFRRNSELPFNSRRLVTQLFGKLLKKLDPLQVIESYGSQLSLG
jgi:hypothetical protein